MAVMASTKWLKSLMGTLTSAGRAVFRCVQRVEVHLQCLPQTFCSQGVRRTPCLMAAMALVSPRGPQTRIAGAVKRIKKQKQRMRW